MICIGSDYELTKDVPYLALMDEPWSVFCERKKHKHDDVIKWKHFLCYWRFVRGIHRSPVNSLHKGQWRWALMFSLICAWMNAWVNNHEAGDLRCHCTHYDVTVMRMFHGSLYHPSPHVVVWWLLLWARSHWRCGRKVQKFDRQVLEPISLLVHHKLNLTEI